MQEVQKSNSHKGRFWCHIRKDFFSWDDLITYYKICDLIEKQNKRKG